MTKIVVVGGGSAGKRHAKNFKELGCDVAVVETREDRRKEVEQKIGVQTYENIASAIAAKKPEGAVVAVPPRFHMPVAQELVDNDLHTLIEKPPFHEWEGVMDLYEKVKKKNLKVMIGFTHRFWRPLIQFKALLPKIGRILSADAVFSEHGDDRHAGFGETAKDFFLGQASLGGGALMEDCHPTDFVRWLFGEPEQVMAMTANASGVGQDVDDVADMLIKIKDIIVRVHVDMFGRPHQKRVEAIGTKGTLRWDFYTNTVEVWTPGEKLKELTCETFYFQDERNDMFIDEEKHFLEAITQDKPLLYPLEDGLKTLDLMLSAKQSAESGKSVKLPNLFTR